MKSSVASIYRERVFGKDLCQLNFMDMEQLEKLLEVLNLSSNDRVLDLGCGIGRIAEYISDVTGAYIIGIDISPEAIEIARKRTRGKRNRLEFQEGNMNNLSLTKGSVDTIIAIDVLHFVENLDNTINQMKALLKPHGEMGIFSSVQHHIKRPNLNNILKKYGFTIQTWDFSNNEQALLHRMKKTVRELKKEFHAENNIYLYKLNLEMSKRWLRAYNSGKGCRFLYYATLP